MSNMIEITVDNQAVRAEEGAMLLDVLRGMGIYIPTLCNHPALAPSGSCRLCIVEVGSEKWPGVNKLVTSCLYPVEQGLIVKTRSSEVLKTRRALFELYLAEFPDSEEIKAMARLEGIEHSSFAINENSKSCILCGLCTRVCQDYGPGAIATQERGITKYIGPGPDNPAELCTGCRTCASICPTSAITLEQKEGILTIWGREFQVPVCSVDPSLCRGCGLCEEVCPFSVPRSLIKIGEEALAYISSDTCRGCGICAGSCPSGAISQKVTEEQSSPDRLLPDKLTAGKDIIFGCSRIPKSELKENLIRVSCIGAVQLTTVLNFIAAGARSVSLICREKQTCPFGAGCDLAEKMVNTISELLDYLGLQKKRVTLLKPGAGPSAPRQAWEEYTAKLDQAGCFAKSNRVIVNELSLDSALLLIEELKNRPTASINLPVDVASLLKQQLDYDKEELLYLGYLPELHLLVKLCTGEDYVLAIIKSALQFLNRLGIKAKPVISKQQLAELNNSRILTLFPPSEVLQENGFHPVSLDQLAGRDKGKDFRFSLSRIEKKELLDLLKNTKGDKLCVSPAEYLQLCLMFRSGTWQSSPLKTICIYEEGCIETGSRDHEQTDSFRITKHPILPAPDQAVVDFSFNGRPLKARNNEVVTSALYASGIHVFGHHKSDDSAQGIYCVNGQCSQCMVIANGRPVKGCMTPVTEGMVVESVEGVPGLSDAQTSKPLLTEPPLVETDVLIIGGGPAGISAAIELGRVGINTLLVDDKQQLGGKLSLQTHNFFGSVDDCFAGTRGMQIGDILLADLNKLPAVKQMLNSTAIGVFTDGKIGISSNGTYKLVKAKKILFTTGAREKSLAIPGADLPGVYGAGAFQTLVNRDLIRCAERLFIVGGGNVGLIGAYHALQAGIDVVGLVEALPRCGGYKVHEDKIKRFGVPIWTAHTVLRIEGKEKVERVIIAAIDDNFKPVPGTERAFNVDTVLIAVGLSPVNELHQKATEYGMDVYAAGDANEIAEASAAIFSGKIIGRRIAQSLGVDLPIPSEWEEFGNILKQHSPDSKPFTPPDDKGNSVYPLIRCVQEIPCNPCTEACPKNLISMKDSILSLPDYSGGCIGCGKCVLACPGLAINLVIEDYDPDQEKALLMMPFEFNNDLISIGSEITTTDMTGNPVGTGKIIALKEGGGQNSRRLLMLEVPYEQRHLVAGYRVRDIDAGEPVDLHPVPEDDPIVCRCERVRRSEIVRAIRDGVRDMNQLKALLRTGLGGCNGKTCTDLILRLYKEEGIPVSEVTLPTHRPLVAEVHLDCFLGSKKEDPNRDGS